MTPHFTLEELTHSQTAARWGIENIPKGQELINLRRLAETMERVRTILGDKPILVSSGYRSKAVNSAVGGSPSSAHIAGLAIDFTCPGFGTPLHVCRKLEPHLAALFIDQLIYEFGTWVHLGLRPQGVTPRHQVLTIDNKGTRSGLKV